MAKPIRVLFSIGSLGAGGSERQMIEILRHVDRSRITPLLYLIYRDGALLHEVPDDVTIVSFEEDSNESSWLLPGTIHRRQVRDMSHTIRDQQIDVVYDRLYFMTMIAGPAAAQARVPRISVIDCDPAKDFGGANERFRWLKYHKLRRAYLTAAQTVSTSEGVRRGATDYYRLPGDCVATIYNFVDIERIDRLSADASPQWDEDRFHIISVGRLQEQKGYEFLLRAVDELVNRRNRKEIQLHILGSGPLQSSLQELARSSRIADHVCLHGYISNPYPYFHSAQLYCLSSLFEGMPNVLLEALTCQVPVLATDCPSGPDEILDHGKFGRLVPPGNSDAIADAIEDAIDNYETWKQFAGPARQRVEELFSASVTVRKTESLIETVCDSYLRELGKN